MYTPLREQGVLDQSSSLGFDYPDEREGLRRCERVREAAQPRDTCLKVLEVVVALRLPSRLDV